MRHWPDLLSKKLLISLNYAQIHFLFRFDVPLDSRLEFLTLAVSNAKSHPIAVNGKYETAIAFLLEIEDQLEVTKVQMEVLNVLAPRINEPDGVGEKIQLLQRRIFNITEVRRYSNKCDWGLLTGFNSYINSTPNHLTFR